MNCHPERSEGSAVRRKMQVPRFARDGKVTRIASYQSRREALMQFSVTGCDVWRINFFLRDHCVQRSRRPLEFARIFAG
jgi:hypothetical protein